MKKKLIKISLAISCLALAVGMAIPAFANTVTYSHNLPTADGYINLTAQQTATRDTLSLNAVHEIDYLAYDNSINCWISNSLSDPYGGMWITGQDLCSVGKTNMYYIEDYVGTVALWTQQSTYRTYTELCNGIVAFH